MHIAESLHWYGRDGSPQYTVIGANGKERDTNLRDARKLGLVPSVTTIIKCAAAPGLERWKREQMMLSALTLSRQEGESEVAFLARVEHDSRETARKAAERGTSIHAAVQGHFEGKAPPQEYWPHVKGAVAVLREWAGEQKWAAERSFASQLGFGGKVDLSSPEFVCDFKSKEFGPDADLKTWDEQEMQLGAYREGLRTPQARCAIVYVSATHPGLARLIEIPQADLVKGWKCFYSLLQFWKARAGYECSFERALAA